MRIPSDTLVATIHLPFRGLIIASEQGIAVFIVFAKEIRGASASHFLTTVLRTTVVRYKH